MHYKQKHIYIGIDPHKEQHTAVIIDCWDTKLGVIKLENKPAAFPELLKEVKKHTKKGITPVFGMEDIGGYGRNLAVFLVDSKQAVKEVNPSKSSSERKSDTVVQKHDDWDAFCIAEVLLRKLETLPDANPQDLFWTISQMVTRRNAIVKAATKLKNQLHMQLSYNYPSYKKFFVQIEGKAATAFWNEYPSPYLLKDTKVEDLAIFLQKASRNSCSTNKAQDILSLIEKDGDTTRDYQEQRDFLIRSIVRDLKFKQQELLLINEELKKVMGWLDYKLETMPGISTVTASSLVAEIGDIRRFKNPDKLARFAGIAPVVFGSAGKNKNYKSERGNRILHGIFYFLAVEQVQVSKINRIPRNPVFYEYYQAKIREGKTKGQALVCVMRRLVNIIYGMMKNKTEYIMPALPDKSAV